MEPFIRFTAQDGQQAALFQCPVEDILYGGARGGGKSYGVLGHFDRHQGEYGRHAKGIIFRRTYAELEDIVGKAREIFTREQDLSKCVWNDSKKILAFPNGATLKFRYLEKDKDADRYQGHEYTWICIEEAGNFPSPVPIDKLRACLRSGVKVDKFFILTANPGGPGHNWIKSQYIDPATPETVHWVRKKVKFKGKDKEVSWRRVFIPAKVTDNRILMENDPNYVSNIVASAGGQEWLLKAWLEGDWNIVAGGMFDDVWNESVHILPNFVVPQNWTVYRAFDWGSSKPFSVGWWAVTDGNYVSINGRLRLFYPGTVIRIGEWYGWNGTPNVGLRLLESEFIEQLFEKEEVLRKKYGIRRIYNGPADSAIFTVQDGESIADKHEMRGVPWEKASKGPGSRVAAWQEIRQLLSNSLADPMEEKGLFITEDCLQFRRIIPAVQRDPKNLDDIDTEGEDHICDETGYFVRFQPTVIQTVGISGI